MVAHGMRMIEMAAVPIWRAKAGHTRAECVETKRIRRRPARAAGLLAAMLCLFPTLGVAQTATDDDGTAALAAIIADQIREQGFACDKSLEANLDPSLSRPGEPVWILVCRNATYRVTVRADQAARVELIGGP